MFAGVLLNVVGLFIFKLVILHSVLFKLFLENENVGFHLLSNFYNIWVFVDFMWYAKYHPYLGVC